MKHAGAIRVTCLQVLVRLFEYSCSPVRVAIAAQDMPNAVRQNELEQCFELSAISKRQTVRVFATSAENGVGLQEGFTWICDQLKKKK